MSQLNMPLMRLEDPVADLEGLGITGGRMGHGRFVDALARLFHLGDGPGGARFLRSKS